ncbi:uncharacterized protein METZ01_LOCUS107826, partial [marine metagenome]
MDRLVEYLEIVNLQQLLLKAECKV